VFVDREPLRTGLPVDLPGVPRGANPGAAINGDVSWQSRWVGALDRVEDVALKVRAGAGGQGGDARSDHGGSAEMRDTPRPVMVVDPARSLRRAYSLLCAL
jgi:hypothetical protein